MIYWIDLNAHITSAKADWRLICFDLWSGHRWITTPAAFAAGLARFFANKENR